MIDLHCHALGSLPAQTVWQRSRQQGADWNAAFSRHHELGLDPPMVHTVDGFVRSYELHAPQEGDPFLVFQAKYALAEALFIALRRQGRGPLQPAVAEELRWLLRVVDARCRSAGVTGAELRWMLPGMLSSGQARQALLVLCEELRGLADEECRIQLAISLPRSDPWRHGSIVCDVLRRFPEYDNIVAVDFCHYEVDDGVQSLADSIARVQAFNQEMPERALAILVHVGEQLRHLSLESALRQVDQARELGAHRLGHALIAGVDPSFFVPHRRRERVGQRQAHVDWCLAHVDELRAADLVGDPDALVQEQRALQAMDRQHLLSLDYSEADLETVQVWQAWVCGRLRASGSVVEVCPSSNAFMLGLRDFRQHPLLGFRRHGVHCAIGTDDGGIFGCTLSDEWQRVGDLCGLHADQLVLWQQQHAMWCSPVLSGRTISPD